MVTSSNGNILRVTGHLCGEFTGHRWIPFTKASDTELDVFVDLRLNERLNKQSRGWWFETPSRPLWRHSNGIPNLPNLSYFDWFLRVLHQALRNTFNLDNIALMRSMWCKNIERHTAHTIVSWPNPKQWMIVHTSDLMMMIKQSIYYLNHQKENG